MSENTADKQLIRLDMAVAAKLNISRTIAADIIEKGRVKVKGKTIYKAGEKVDSGFDIEIEEGTKTFVSRGGFKLQAALKGFSINLAGLICMDVGASAGGFTDCMLKNGAKKVYAIDSGTGQLKEALRENPAVISMENTDIRSLDAGTLPKMDFVCIDVSFISLDKVLPKVYDLMAGNSRGIVLLKPQFEAGPGAVNKKGIIKNTKVRQKVLDSFYIYAKNMGFICKGHMESPIKGAGGNEEFLVHLAKGGQNT